MQFLQQHIFVSVQCYYLKNKYKWIEDKKKTVESWKQASMLPILLLESLIIINFNCRKFLKMLQRMTDVGYGDGVYYDDHNHGQRDGDNEFQMIGLMMWEKNNKKKKKKRKPQQEILLLL